MKFAEVLEIRNGRNQHRVENENGKYPIYGSGGVIGYADDYICDSETVVIGRKGNINHPIFVEEPFWNVDTAFGLIANKNILIPKYLFYFCLNYDFERLNTTVTIPSLTKLNLMQIDMKVPGMEKQREIVAILDKIVSIILDRQQELQKLDLFVQSRFLEMFGRLQDNQYGYDVVTIENVCSMIKDGTHQTPVYTENTEEGYKFLSSKDVMTQKIDWSDIKYIPADLHKKLYAVIKPQRNDVLMSKNGVNYGVAALNDTDEVFDIYVSIALLRPTEVINPVFFRCAINNPDTKRQFDGSIKGIGVPNLHLGEIKKTRILLPPLYIQNQFAAFVHQIDKSKYRAQKRYRKNTFCFFWLNKKIQIIDISMHQSA